MTVIYSSFFINGPISQTDVIPQAGHPQALLEIYIAALLVDEELADQVWDAWIAEKLTDGAAYIAWLLVAGLVSRRNH